MSVKEKSNKKCYISLPITGLRLSEVEIRAAHIKRMLAAAGYQAVSPLNNGVCRTAPIEVHMRVDYATLLGCDCILMADGWERSPGCRAEILAAATAGIKIVFERAEVLNSGK